ncbi:tetratricopeptide repeat protein [Actinocorallia longicatena]|uniref:Tetratricopeptide repeat protein n=1 Tax=Actinocorallia longicatena TaxID=111803 RepID=A0ABP6QF21_9ACTN
MLAEIEAVFTDREEALEAFDAFLRDASRVLLFWGVAGQGKSALLRELSGRTAEPGLVDLETLVDYESSDGLDLAEVLIDRLAAFLLGRSGRRSAFLRQRYRRDKNLARARFTAVAPVHVQLTAVESGTIERNEINVDTGAHLRYGRAEFRDALIRALCRIAGGRTALEGVLMIDTLERLTFLDGIAGEGETPTRIRHWFVQELLPALCVAAPSVKIVLAGRERLEIPEGLCRRQVELTEWTPADSATYLTRVGVTDAPTVKGIQAACGGLPLWTSLAADACRLGEGGDASWSIRAAEGRVVHEWLPREFLRRLPHAQREIVTAATVPRVITKEVVGVLLPPGDREPDWYTKLCGLSFVRLVTDPTGRSEIRMHDLIRSALLAYLEAQEPALLAGLHARAAAYHAAGGTVLDSAYHRFASGDFSLEEQWRRALDDALQRHDLGQALQYTSIILAPELRTGLAERRAGLLNHARVSAAQIALHQGDPVKAEELLLLVLETSADDSLRLQALDSLGDILLRQGDAAGAEQRYREALNLARRIDHDLGIVTALSSLGDVQLRRGALPSARELYAEAMEHVLRKRLRKREGLARRSMGRILLAEGDRVSAREHFLSALAIFRDDRHALNEGRTLVILGRMDSTDGDLTAARERFTRALVCAREAKSGLHEANALLASAEVELKYGGLEIAESAVRKALELFVQVGSQLGAARSTRCLGDISLARQDATEAARRYREALAAFERISVATGAAAASAGLAFALRRLGEPAAEASHEDARRRFAAMGRTEAKSYARLERLWG